uniref:Mediator of RNA polymerase II transcription subunit 20 n=1 Tax=Schistocephalus solidus TaxID=70667 RepID=A0A183T4U2_SCHSO
LAPKGSRAKWHATQVWKETDCAAVRLNTRRTSEHQTSCLTTSSDDKTQKRRTQKEEGKVVGSDNSLSSLASLSDSFGDSDSGVQENVPFRSLRNKQAWLQQQQQQQSSVQGKDINEHGGLYDLNELLSEIGVDTGELADSFKVVRLFDGHQSPAVGAGGEGEVLSMDRKQYTDQESEAEEGEAALLVASQQGLLAAVEDDDNASTNSNLNTMSDIPSITAATVDGEEEEHETLYNSPAERRCSNVIRFLKPHLNCCRLVDSGTQTVVIVPIPKSQTATQTVNGLIKRCELLGAVELYPTKIESSVYRSVAAKQASCFIISDKDQILTCDLAFREFPGLLRGVYEYEQKLQVRGIGKKYRLGDFTMNFVSLYLGQSPTVKGVLLEVAFLPAAAPHLVKSFLKLYFPEIRAESIKDSSELSARCMQKVLDEGSLPQAPPSPMKALLGQTMQSWSNFADRLSVLQYVEHLNILRSPTCPPVSS